MNATEAERPAVAIAMQRGAEIVHIGRLNSFDATPSLRNFQAAHLALRFGLAPHLAEVISSLAWAGAR
jgi:hypothetical protein